jgi:hypothetical protein
MATIHPTASFHRQQSVRIFSFQKTNYILFFFILRSTVIAPSEKALPPKLNFEIITAMQVCNSSLYLSSDNPT